MQSPSSPPPASALSGVIFIAAIVVWATSPAKWQTFKRMVFSLLATMAMIIALGLVLSYLGYGNPEFFGEVSIVCGIIGALAMGRQHVYALKKQMKADASGKAP